MLGITSYSTSKHFTYKWGATSFRMLLLGKFSSLFDSTVENFKLCLPCVENHILPDLSEHWCATTPMDWVNVLFCACQKTLSVTSCTFYVKAAWYDPIPYWQWDTKYPLLPMMCCFMINHMIDFNVADFVIFSRKGLMSWVWRGTTGPNCKTHVSLFGKTLQLSLLLLLIPFVSLAFCTSVQLPCNLDHKLHASIVTSTPMSMSYLPWDTLHEYHPQQHRPKTKGKWINSP
jgi:hypothetical protein